MAFRKIWHMSIRGRSRAFVLPKGFCFRIYLFFRGYRPFNDIWWSKPNAKVRKLLKQHSRDAMIWGFW